MRKLALAALLAGAMTLGACATYPAPVRATAANLYSACGSYGMVDRNNDGFVSNAEWDMYRTSAYGYWDVNHDGRVDRTEFQNCWYQGGFYAPAYYNRDYWQPYWTAFDTNNDGYLSNDEYWSASAWVRADRNRNGRIDANEWQWWM